MAENKEHISWVALEYEHHKKSAKWFLGLLIVTILILGYAVWQKDWLMLVTFVILLSAIYLYARRNPKKIKIKLSEKGVTLDQDEYPYGMIKSFWIMYEPPGIKTLSFEMSQYVNRELVLQLADADPNEIREFLLEFLEEDLEHEEKYSDKLMRKLKF